MNRYAPASCHKAHNLIAGNRIAALGEPDRHIRKPLDHDSALGLGQLQLVVLVLGHRLHHLFIGDFLLVDLLVLLHHLVDDLAFLQAAMTDGSQDRIPVLEAIFAHHRSLEFRLHDVDGVDRFQLAILGKHFLALQNIFFLEFVLKPLIDFIFGLGALNHIQPVAAGASGILGGNDLDPVAILDLIINGHQLSVYPRADHLVSYGAVYTVGKVDRRRAAGKRLDLSGRRKAVDALRKQIQIAFQQIHKLLIIGHVPLPLQNLAQPGHLLCFLLIDGLLSVAAFLVFPMRRDTVFRGLMHLIGTDLNLKGLPVGPDQGRVQGLVHIRLRHGDIVLKPARNRLIHFMNHAQSRITVLDGLYDDADRKEIIDLIQRLVLIHHLLVDAKKMLNTPVHVGLNARVFHMLLYLCHNLLYKGLPIAPLLGNLFLQIIIDLRLQIFQRQVIQLILDLGNTEPLGNGRIDIHRLPGLLLLLLRLHVLKSPHIVKAVGKLYQNHADILCHSQKHLAQVLCLNLDLIRRIGELAQLCDAIHQKGDLIAKFCRNLLLCHHGILYRIVQKARDNGLLIKLQIRQDNGDTERMNDIRLPRLAKLPLMSRRRNLISLLNHADIGRRMILQHAVDQLFVKHIRACKILHGLYIFIIVIYFHIPVFHANLHLCHCQHLPFAAFYCFFLFPLVPDHGSYIVFFQELPSFQACKLHQKDNLYHFTAQGLYQLRCRLYRSASGNQIIHKNHLLSRLDRILMHLNLSASIFQIIFLRYRLTGQLAFFADQHEGLMKIISNRCSEHKASGLRSHNHIKVYVLQKLLHGVNRQMQTVRILQH